MRRLLSLAAVLAMLSLAACGDDEETTPAGDTGGATGVQDTSSGDFFTAKQFLDASLPDQVEEVRTIAGITPECEGVKANEDFQVSVSINAAQAAGAAPDTPMQEIVADQCAGG
jgi:hypothetical protein